MRKRLLIAALSLSTLSAWAQPCDPDGGDCPFSAIRDGVEGALSLDPIGERKIDANEPSGLTVLKDGRILAVDDERGLYDVTDGRGERIDLKNGKKLDGPEGITVSGDGKTLYVVSEDDGKVHAIDVERDGGFGEPESLGRLPDLDGVDNKGWEGIAWLPAKANPERRNRLALVHEGSPRRVGLFDPRDLDGDVELLELPDDLKDELDDLSDIAVDPATGHLFLLSDESSKIAEVRLVKDGRDLALETVALRKLPFRKGLRPEGVALDGDGNLLVATEGDGKIRTLRVR